MPDTKRKSAFIRATQEAQRIQEPAQPLPPPITTDASQQEQQHSSTVQQSNTVSQLNSETANKATKKEKISFYLDPEDSEKLSELEVTFWQQQKRRINRNDIIRHLIKQCTMDDLRGL